MDAYLSGLLEKKLSGLEENALLPPEGRLADEFGVSKPTLRRALQRLVTAGRVRKINGVGAVISKKINAYARELIFLCADLTFFADALKHFSTICSELNYWVSIVPLSGDARTQELTIASVANRHPAGVAIYADPTDPDLPAFHQFGVNDIPSVFVARLPRGLESNLVEIGNEDGMTQIVDKLYGEGCRTIGFYTDKRVNPAAAIEREQGFLAGLKKRRLKPKTEFICSRDATDELRDAFFQQLARSKNAPDAICCANDLCAGRFIKRLKDHNAKIDNIRFTGFDHSPLSEFLPTPLLTVELPMKNLGKMIADTLIRQVENPKFSFQKHKLKSRLISVNAKKGLRE